MKKKIDLHVHTTASDGTLTPKEVVQLAASRSLAAIAITDHDTLSGYSEASNAAEECALEVVPGIEISTEYNGAVHILGYYIDLQSPDLQAELNWIVEERDYRNEKICSLMQRDGIAVSYEEMKERFGAVIGRPHFAKILVERGLASDVQDGFRRYIGKGGPYYQRRQFLSLERSIKIIRIADGIPVLAHPFQYRLDDSELRELIEHCMECGLHGLECLYSGYTEKQSRYLINLAQEYHLLATGGSDFHGSVKPLIQLGCGTGDLDVPYSFLEELKKEHLKMP